MAEEEETPPPPISETVVVRRERPLWARIAGWIGIVLVVLVVLLAALIVGLNTGPGKRFIAHELAGYNTASGINVRVHDIEGSIYGHMILHGVEVRDTKGVFLTAPTLDIDWRPFAYLHSKIDLKSVQAPLVTLLRKPALKPVPSQPNQPILPNIDLTLGRLRVDRFVIEPPVTGKRHLLKLAGGAQIADRRAQIALDAAALTGPGIAGGDRLHLRLDAVPEADRLMVDLKLDAPTGGVVDSYMKLGKPLSLRVAGHGDWRAWQGRAMGTLGGQALVNIALTGRNGTFHAAGGVNPGLLFKGSAARLTQPFLRIDATATLNQRRADTHILARSDALAVEAKGLLDFANSSFGDFRMQAKLLTPGTIAKNLKGRNIAFAAVLDGPMARPTVAYRLTADAIAFGATGVEGLVAQGKAMVNADKILVPVHATVRRVTGVNASIGGLVTNLRLDGTFAYSKGQIFSDDLHLRSDRIDATALVLADLKTGTYTGALKGRVNDYLVNGLGRINLTTDAHLVTAKSGGFGIKGRVRIVTRKITNSAIAGQLGGNAVITADIAYDPKGEASATNIRLTAPDFRITGGSATYRPSDGAFRLTANAWSRSYGPIAVIGSGTAARPKVMLKAAHPGVGIGLVNLEATLTGSAAGYEVHAKGGSNYGPFTADLLIRSGKGPLAVDIRELVIAGITARGSIVKTAAGPFAGTLAISGSGLHGDVRLAAAGKVQRADLNITANGARLPGNPPITIGKGLVRASVLLLPQGPSVNGSAALVDVRRGTVLIRSARARIEYAAGRGRVALTAAGSSGVPFDIAAQAAITPDRILANIKGSANTIPFHLAQPAVVTRAGGDYVLAPATLVLPQGTIQLSGRYGAQTQFHAKLNGVDLSITQAFAPMLGLGGKATGTIDLAMAGGATVPTARARIDINGFTRTGAMVVSEPVNVATLLTLSPAGAEARALIQRGGTTIGRLQARLAPIPGGSGSWMSRLMAAPLSGGIRYNGPADVLWTLTGIAKQTLSGPIAVGADFSGRLDNPTLNGVIRANQLRYENATYGTTITNIAIDGRFTQSQFQINRFTGKAGDGTISAKGSVDFAAASGFPIDLTATFDHAQLAHSDALGATVTGTLSITNSKAAGGLIKGDLRVPEARYQITREGAADIPDLTGVRRKGAPPPKPTPPGPAPSNWKLDIHLRADNQIFVSGMGLESEWRTNMHVTGTTSHPQVVGRLEVVRGSYSFAGRRLTLSDASTVTFNGPLTTPELNITATTTVQDVDVGLSITGSAQKPQISFTSTPSLPQDEILSRLLFGGPASSLSATQALQLAAALNSLRGSGGGLNPLGKIRSATGLDRLQVLGADQTTGRGTALEAGKYISNRIYVEVITDAKGFTQTQLTIALSKALSILSQAGGVTGPSVSLKYSKQY